MVSDLSFRGSFLLLILCKIKDTNDQLVTASVYVGLCLNMLVWY